MGTVIMASWPAQTSAEQQELQAAWLTRTHGGAVGVLAAYNSGEAMALMRLCLELFQSRPIPAALMRARLDTVLEELEQALRAEKPSHSDETVGRVKQNYRDFVAFCERKEQETGQPVVFSLSD